MENNKLLDEYLAKTGQSMGELMEGTSQTGISYVLHELVPKAMKENKKIKWVSDEKGKLVTGAGHYLLEDII